MHSSLAPVGSGDVHAAGSDPSERPARGTSSATSEVNFFDTSCFLNQGSLEMAARRLDGAMEGTLCDTSLTSPPHGVVSSGNRREGSSWTSLPASQAARHDKFYFLPLDKIRLRA